MKTLTIKVPDELFSEIENAALARNVSKSEIVRERLERLGNKTTSAPASLWSRMKDLVIDDDSLPPDLSANQQHLRNYGKNRSDR